MSATIDLSDGQGRNGALDAALVALVFLTLLSAFAISANLLEANGINYGSPGGNPLSKFHPATYLAVLAFLTSAARFGNPIAYFVAIGARFPGLALFFLTYVGMVLWTGLVQRTPVSGLVDTFLAPMLCLPLVAQLNERQHAVLTRLLHILMVANAAIGVAEAATGWRLTPVLVQGDVIDWDWRSTALLGHPLGNAAITGVYMVIMFFGADRSIGPRARAAILILEALAMNAFGGRTAIVAALVVIGPVLVARFVALLGGRQFDKRSAAVVVAMIPLLVAAAAVAYDLGAFDRLVERFTSDEGSANTRLIMLRIFNSFSWHDLLMGPDQEVLSARTWVEGTTAGIESFVFGFFLQYGILISLIFFAGLAAFSAELWRLGSRYALVSLLYFYAVVAGAASLNTKSTTLMLLTALFLTVEARPAVSDPDDDR